MEGKKKKKINKERKKEEEYQKQQRKIKKNPNIPLTTFFMFKKKNNRERKITTMIKTQQCNRHKLDCQLTGFPNRYQSDTDDNQARPKSTRQSGKNDNSPIHIFRVHLARRHVPRCEVAATKLAWLT